MPDPRALEKMTSDLTRMLREKNFGSEKELQDYLKGVVNKGKIPESPPKSAIHLAQDIMYEAWDTDDKKRRLELAHEAISVSPDCADAYVLLAEEEAKTIEEAKDLYLRGVEAGKRALGEEIFEEDCGHFWGMLETRPYMRARAGLVQCLWETGRYDEAVEHCFEMLRLNKNDNQGMRHLLAAYLADMERYDDLDKLLNSGDFKNDCSPAWLYTRALLSFVKMGDTLQARHELKTALKGNPYVPDYIVGKKAIPRILPDQVTMGREDEGMYYAANFVSAWKRIPGAIEWLQNQAKIKIYPKVGRNEPCPCGSGRKYKKCCGR